MFSICPRGFQLKSRALASSRSRQELAPGPKFVPMRVKPPQPFNKSNDERCLCFPRRIPCQSLLGRRTGCNVGRGEQRGCGGDSPGRAAGICRVDLDPLGQGTSLLLGCSPSPSPGRLCSHKGGWKKSRFVFSGGFQPFLRGEGSAARPLWAVQGMLPCHSCSAHSLAWPRQSTRDFYDFFPHKWCSGGRVAAPGQGSCLCHLEGVWLWGIGLFVPVREGNGAGPGCWAQRLLGSAGQGVC